MQKEIFLLFLLLPVYMFGQDKTRENLQWNTIISAGILAGESNVKPLFQLTGGIKYNRYFTGIGIGYDTYEYNSIPVFADWWMSFGKKKIGFIYGNGGYNFPAGYKSDPEFSKTDDFLTGGLIWDAGIGYRIPLGSLHRLAFSAGFSQKNITQRKVFVNPCLLPPCPEDIHEYKYSFNRLLARLSWEIGK